MSVFRTKSIEASMASAEEADHQLKRTLSALDLIVFGVGVIIGAGIFTLPGRGAYVLAGP
jgi:APA family basic amino acid/polyamine antiporter